MSSAFDVYWIFRRRQRGRPGSGLGPINKALPCEGVDYLNIASTLASRKEVSAASIRPKV